MSRKPKGLQNTLQVRLYPDPSQGRLLMEQCQEYIGTVNVLSSALDADLIPDDDTFSTKDFVAVLPSCVKNQVPASNVPLVVHATQHRTEPISVLIVDGWDIGMQWVQSISAEGLAYLVTG